MLGFQENLVGVGPICDANCKVTCSKHAVSIYSPTGNPIIIGWHETDGPCIRSMYLLPNPEDVPPLSSVPDVYKNSLQYFRAYDLTIVEALVQYFHAVSEFPVRNTWLKDIKVGNFTSWLGIIVTDETLKGHVV